MRPSFLIRCLFFFTVLSCINNHVTAQTGPPSAQLNIRNFSIFGGDQSSPLIDSTLSGVFFTGGGIVNSGSIGSYSFVVSLVQDNLNANVYSGHHIHFGSSDAIRGSVTSGISFPHNDTVIKSGTGTFFGPGGTYGSYGSDPGSLTANGSIALGANNTVTGAVRIPAGRAYIGPTPGGGLLTGSVNFPQLPQMPPTSPWGVPGVGADLTSTGDVVPGVYHNINLTGGQTLTFRGPGKYIFNAIANTAGSGGTSNTFVFDFQNTETGTFQLYINGNVDLQKLKVQVINNGRQAAGGERIYTEVHGSGNANGYAFNLEGDPGLAPSGPPSPSTWLGTVWATKGGIRIGSGGPTGTTVAIVNGCLWSVSKVRIEGFSVVNYVPLVLSVNPVPNVDILPYYPPPDGGKVNQSIGSELESLYENFNPANNTSGNSNVNFIYQITGNKVKIEVIALQGMLAQTLAFLQSKGFVLINSHGLVLTGSFPIPNLLQLNTRPDLIDYSRPLYLPLNNSGLTTTQGDSAMRTNFVKKNFNINGEGVKVGVISNSYNTILGDFASVDVANGDLPGATNPNGYLTPVDVVMDYPTGHLSDEGRAMLQIVHDVAPKAPLAFRTGFICAGDFAQGIQQLATGGCKVIVDDVTYITEPFFRDGVIAQAVNQVVAAGVSYFSAAGNFGRKAFDGVFNGIPAPNGLGISGLVHDFGGGNALQQLTFLDPGSYTIVLQWDDDIYSVGSPSSGTQTDLDIYLVDNGGTTLFGFNRNNLGTDPFEVLPFTVTTPTTGQLLIAKASGPAVPFKLIVFRGNLIINGYAGASTLVGQANAAGANAVGAVYFGNTPAFGVNPPTIASFSSVGGTIVNGAVRNKPEFTAPNGVNTTVFMGSLFSDGDIFPNFFGTSAAAPHAAAAAALLIQAKQKFQSQVMTPAQVTNLLKSTAIDMGAAGYDPESGAGFIQPFAAIRTFASPAPTITGLIVPPGVTPGLQVFTVTVTGEYLNPQTKVFFRGSELATTYDPAHPNQVTASIPLFADNPPVQLYNPPITSSTLDGGLSDALYFKHRPHVVVTADNQMKKYGEMVPPFSSTITVDGQPLSSTPFTAQQLGLNNLQYQTSATSASNVGNYFIRPLNPFNPANPADAALLELYSYEFIDGILTVQKMPLHITPRDTTVVFGAPIKGINFNYLVGPSQTIQNPDSLINAIDLSHKSLIIDSVIALVNVTPADTRALVNSDLDNMSIIVSGGSAADTRALVNGDPPGTNHVIDVAVQSIINYQSDPANGVLINGGAGADTRALVNGDALANGTAGADTRALVNGDPTLLNDNTASATSNANAAVIVSSSDVPALTNNEIELQTVNMVTGLTPGTHAIVPAAFLSENFDITYGIGTLTILPGGHNWYVSVTGSDITGDGSLANPWRHMQFANDNPLVHGTDVINVLAGDYTEFVNVTKSLRFYGPNWDVSPNNPATPRVAEAVIHASSSAAAPHLANGTTVFEIRTSGINVEVKGFKLMDGNPIHDGHMHRDGTNPQDIVVLFEKNWVQNADHVFAGTLTRWINVTIRDNFFDNINFIPNSSSAIMLHDQVTTLSGPHTPTVTALIEDNVISNTQFAGILVDNLASATVRRNKLTNMKGEAGIQLAGGMVNATVTMNEITNANTASAAGADDGGIKIYGSEFTGNITITNNLVTGCLNGFAVKNGEVITDGNIHVNNNSFGGNTNKSMYHGGTNPGGLGGSSAQPGTLDGECNWHGASDNPTVVTKVQGPIDYVFYLSNGTDGDPATIGFQPSGFCTGGPIAPPPLDQDDHVRIFPMPVTSIMKVEYIAPEQKKVDIVIVDHSGRILVKENTVAMKGINLINFDVHLLIKGIYTVIISDGTKQWHQKIIKL